MIEISLNKVTKNYGFNNILDNISFEVKTNEKVAIIGENGCGKTTILKLITKEEYPNSGDIFIRKNANIGVLKQDYKENIDKNVKDIIYSSFIKENEIKRKLDKEETNMLSLTGSKLEKSIERYSKLQQEYIDIGGYEIDTKVQKIVSVFKVERLLNTNYNVLSGGEKTIINLICLLLQKPDILLLDEPTNHLDIEMIEWLENYLINYNGTLIVISHDRYFLDKVCNKTILINNGHEDIYFGNYTYFLNENERRIEQEFKEYKNQQKQIEAMKKAIKRLKEYGKLAYPCGEMFFKRAASIEKRLEKIEKLDKPKDVYKIPINFITNERTGKDVITVKNYSLGFNDRLLLDNISFNLYYKEKLCIIGKNGSGKSAFIKSIINNKDNNIKIGSNVKIGYIPQSFTFDDENITVYEEARKYFIGQEEHLRSALTKFLFYSENINKRLNKLSGGERVRLKLFCLIQEDNNLLILDEPTNHIDINTKEVLEESLSSYNGTLLFISHDRYFINKVASKIVEIKDKKLISYIGNYDDYKLKNMN